MPGITLREVPCSLCGQTFTLLEGDLFMPIPRLCDECLKKHWKNSDDELLALGLETELIELLHHYRQRGGLSQILKEREIGRKPTLN